MSFLFQGSVGEKWGVSYDLDAHDMEDG
jgi:hypothetical protein